jgi:integrase
MAEAKDILKHQIHSIGRSISLGSKRDQGQGNIQKCNANSASAALNKWLKPRLPEGCVIHSFRHSLRDRLRAVECPSDIVDAIGGWTTEGIGQRYGKGYDLNVKARWMEMIMAIRD